jgi:hypothetical protein
MEALSSEVTRLACASAVPQVPLIAMIAWNASSWGTIWSSRISNQSRSRLEAMNIPVYINVHNYGIWSQE